MKKTILSEDAPAPVGPYAQAVAHGNVLYCSGQIALDVDTGILFEGEIETETRLVLQNLEAVLKAGGANRDSVIKCSVFVKDMNLFGRINGVYEAFFGLNQPPARELVEVSRLPKDAQIEISAIAAIVRT